MRNWIAAFAAVLALACPAFGTVLGNPPPTSYSCTGSATSFTVPWPYLAPSQIVVNTITSAGGVATLVLNTDFTVKPSIAPTSGTLTLTNACASGLTLKISRVVPYTQPQSFRTGSYQGAVHEQAFDRLEMQVQQIGAVAASATSSGLLSAADWIRFNQTSFTSLNQYQAPYAGAVSRTIASKFGDVISVKDFGAKGDGTDDTAAVAAALAAVNSNGSTLYFPCGTYLSTAALTISNGASLRGAGRTCTFLSFSGATDGVIVSDATVQPKDWTITDLTITTSNATAGRALNVNVVIRGAIRAVVRDVTVAKSGSGLWTHCLYSANWQVSSIYGFHSFQSCAVGMHFDNFSDALNVYDYEFVGGSGGGPINRGIEVVGDADIRFYGGTLQGYFNQSLININTTVKGQKFYGLHNENTNASPSDGADVVGVGTNVNTTFSGVQGGTFNIASSGSWRNFVLENSEAGITVGVGCVACAVMNVRGSSLVDNSTSTFIIGASTSTGSALAGKMPAHLLAHNTSTIPASVNPSNASLVLANSSLLDWVDSGGVAREVMQMSSLNTVFMTYVPTNQITFRNSTPTTKMVLSDTALTMSVPITAQSVTFATLPTPTNGMILYCSDCTVASPCASGGTGAIAKRIAGAWVCN